MTLTSAVLLFCGSLILSMAASAVLAERLDQCGQHFRLPSGVIGIITALGADAPEIASAVTAIVGGHHEMGRGVIFGSNIFNLAALIGLSAVIAGGVGIARLILAIDAGAALGVTLAVAAQVLGWLPRLWTGIAIAAILVPYLVYSALPRSRIANLSLPGAVTAHFASGTRQGRRSGDKARAVSWADGLSLLPLLSVVVASSIAMVRSAEFLGTRWDVSKLVVGMFVIATLTGIPNLIAAIRLALKGRGDALASEAFNSNTLNLLVGAYLPTFFTNLSPPSHEAILAVAWLTWMTIAAAGLGWFGRGFGRGGGSVLIGAYAAFAVAVMS